jgi:S-adenosylmethionine:tRNA ribosyltransferase-isomerase
MSIERELRIEQFSYDLPESKIANYPLSERDISKLLVYRDGKISDLLFRNLPDNLEVGSKLIFNNTRVIRARLRFRKETGALIEIFCLEPYSPNDHSISFASDKPVEWRCLVGNLKKWKSGSLKMDIETKTGPITLNATRVDKHQDDIIIRFSWESSDLCFSEIIELSGSIPVPPYLARQEEEIDKQRYQTIYSKRDGSVAAPTAGLHFTEPILRTLRKRGIDLDEITLHVGAGTFVPVKSEMIGGHQMHTEFFTVTKNTIDNLSGNRPIAVGTTTVRTLESIYWLGVKIISGEIVSPLDFKIDQWDPYNGSNSIELAESLAALSGFMEINNLLKVEAKTSIIIVPGYRFRVISGLITNFHMPGSTLLLLIAAVTGSDWRRIYNHALENGYRFLSYGDSSLLFLNQNS